MAKKEVYGERLVTPVGMAQFVHLAEKVLWDGDPPEKARYEITMLFPESDRDKFLAIGKATKEMREKLYGDAANVSLPVKQREIDGKNWLQFKASTRKDGFKCVLPDGTIIPPSDIRPGNLIRVSFVLAARPDDPRNRYIRALLNNVKKVSEGSGLPEGMGVKRTTPDEDFAGTDEDMALFTKENSKADRLLEDDGIPF